MKISFDPAKNASNIEKHGVSFEAVAGFDFSTALIAQDTRHEYGEVRFVAYGMVSNRLHALVFVETPNGIRVISFRKANSREVRRYERSS